MTLMTNDHDATKALMTFSSINEKAVEKILQLNKDTQQELQKIQTVDFNIFKIKEYTNENELVTVICSIFAKEKLFDRLPIINEKFLNFTKKI